MKASSEEHREELMRELSVHVVTVSCGREWAEQLVAELRTWMVREPVFTPPALTTFECTFTTLGTYLKVDRNTLLWLSENVLVMVILDDSLSGGATISSRWARPSV